MVLFWWGLFIISQETCLVCNAWSTGIEGGHKNDGYNDTDTFIWSLFWGHFCEQARMKMLRAGSRRGFSCMVNR